MESGTQGHGRGGGPLSTECSIASKILRGGTFIKGDENKKPEAVGRIKMMDREGVKPMSWQEENQES